MKAFSILGGKAHVVELPESDNPFRNLGISIKSELDNKVSGKLHSRGKNGWESVDLPPGTWKIVGMLSELFYHDFDGLIEPTKVFDYTAHHWNYVDKEYQPIMQIESFHSAIRASGYSLENPYDSEHVLKKLPSELAEHLKRHGEAQSRTLPIERTLIIEKI